METMDFPYKKELFAVLRSFRKQLTDFLHR